MITRQGAGSTTRRAARTTCAVAAALSLWSALAAPARADEEPLVKAVARAEQELRDDGKHAEYRFQITPAAGVDAARLKVIASRVTVGGRVDPGLLHAFSPELSVTPSAGVEIVLRVDLDIAAEPGVYEVELALSSDAPKDAAQRTTVKLTHPAAALKLSAPLVVARTWPLFLKMGYPSVATLSETSKRSRLSRISIQQPEAPLHDGEPVDGRLVLTPPAAIDPGAWAALPLSIEGSFPVGTTRGKVEIRAPQLEQPLAVDYEMRVRVTSLAIPFFFLLGAGLATLTRDRLKKREERLDRELRAGELLARLEPLAARSPGDARAELERAASLLKTEQGDDLEKAIKSGGELLAETLARRVTEQREIIAQTSREAAILGRGWLLPPALDVATIRRGFDEANQHAVDDDVVAARVALDGALASAGALTRAARAWAIEAEQTLTTLAAAKPPGGEPLAAALPDLRAGLGAVRAVKAEDGFEPLLRAVHAANEALLDQAWTVSRALVHLADECAGPGPEGDALRMAAETPADHVAETDAQAALAQAIKAARSVEREVRAMVEAMLPSDAERKRVADLLDDHRFEEAVKRARKMVEERRMEASPILSLGAGGDDDDDAPAPAGLAPRARLAAPATRDAARTLVISTNAAEKTTAQVSRQLESTRAARTMISAVIMAGLTWALYEHDFIGTGREIVSFLALGFTTDLSADSLFAALEKVKKA